jgi:hypothetical protein
MTEAEAKVAIDLAAGDVPIIGEPPPDPNLPALDDVDHLLADADAAIAALSDRSR